jgi:Ca2+/Na+ antiporter
MDAAGRPTYSKPPGAGADWKKLDPPGNNSWDGTGVAVQGEIVRNGKFMMGSACLYLIIQLPALVMSDVSLFAVLGCLACFGTLGLYLMIQVKASNSSNAVADARVAAIKRGELSLRGVLSDVVKNMNLNGGGDLEANLLNNAGKMKEVKAVLSPFFFYYDTSGDKALDKSELWCVLSDIKSQMAVAEFDEMYQKVSRGKPTIDLEQFAQMMTMYCKASSDSLQMVSPNTRRSMAAPCDDDGEEEEEEDMPEDLQDLSPEEQQKRVKARAAWMLSVGTLLVLIFSDPAVDVLSEIGKRTGIPAFYISFLLAPMASNASELVAAYNYASKKTSKTMTIALSTLEGAACMNNTYCLGIFLLMVFLQGLKWTFAAETLSIMLVQFIVGAFAMRPVQKLRDGYLVLGLYPVSLVFVYVLENVLGLP